MITINVHPNAKSISRRIMPSYDVLEMTDEHGNNRVTIFLSDAVYEALLTCLTGEVSKLDADVAPTRQEGGR